MQWGGSTFTWSVISGDPINIGTNFSCNNCPNPVATPSVTTTYQVVSDLSAACGNVDQVTVFVVPGFPMTVTPAVANICLNEITQLQVNTPDPSGQPYTYSWSPSTGLSDPSISNPTASPNVSTTYTVTVTSAQGCIQEETVQVNVAGVGATVTGVDTTICPGESVTLNPTIAVQPPTCGITTACTGATTVATVGAGVNSSTIYGPYYASTTAVYRNRHQYLFTAAELNALGYNAGGSIQSIAFNHASAFANQYQNFTVKIGCTNLSEFANGTFIGGLTQVHFVANHNTAAATGFQTINLQNGYDWDGSSNIIIEVCSDGELSGNNISTRYDITTGVFRCIYEYSTVGLGCNEAIGTRTTARPQVELGICQNAPVNPTYSWTPTTGLSNPNILNPVATPTATTNIYVKRQRSVWMYRLRSDYD